MVIKRELLENLIKECTEKLKNCHNAEFVNGKLFAYEQILAELNNEVIKIDSTSLTNRELFIYIAVSLAHSPLLIGIDPQQKQIILRKVCGEFDGMSITNGDVYEIFHAVEVLNVKLGLALNKHIDTKSLSIARENILSKPELIEETIKKIQNDPELIKMIQKTLSGT